MPRFDIDTKRTYNIPQAISLVSVNDKILIISPLTANWIVLQSKSQIDIFNDFREGKSIDDILDSRKYSSNEVGEVVTQIEAKKFCSLVVKKASESSRNLHLYLTNKCNLHCPHCYMFSGQENKNELSTDNGSVENS